MAAKKFTPNEWPGSDSPLGISLVKAEALLLVYQAYQNGDISREAPMRSHWIHWYLETIRDEIQNAQEEGERLEALTRVREVANG